jgi:photosystem II stability/assembly factor-like uncharacterized protein
MSGPRQALRRQLATLILLLGGTAAGCSNGGSNVDASSIRAWALGFGDDVTILRSKDGGGTWEVAARFETSPDEPALRLNDIAFIDSETGWAVGENLFLQTVDAGSSWTDALGSVSLPAGATLRLNAIGFNGSRVGVAAGDESPGIGQITGSPLILITTNAGESWIPAEVIQLSEGRLGTIQSICLTSDGNGVAVGDGAQGSIVLSSQTGGSTWQEATEQVGFKGENVACSDDATLWVLGVDEEGPRLATSRDGGTTWMDQSSGVRQLLESANAIAFADSNGWVAGLSSSTPSVIHSSDGGNSWGRQPFPTGGAVGDFAFISPEQGVAVGATQSPLSSEPAAFHTNDGGDDTWLVGALPDEGLSFLGAVSAVVVD